MDTAITGRQAATQSNDLTRTSGVLLACGIVAGPIYVALGVLQMLIRPGFDITRHDLSLLANGELGWIHVANLVGTGLLTVVGAIGLGRSLHEGPGSRWAPRLLGVYGLGLIAAGVFVADPSNGFPPGTPSGPPALVTTSGLLHLASGGIGFLALIAACLIMARRFARAGNGRWAAFSLATGVIYFAAFGGIVAGSTGDPATVALVTLAFSVAVVLGWLWISAISARARAELSAQ